MRSKFLYKLYQLYNEIFFKLIFVGIIINTNNLVFNMIYVVNKRDEFYLHFFII